MQICCVLLIGCTSLMLRETVAYRSYNHIYKDDHTPLFLAAGYLAGFLAILVSLRKKRPITDATSTTSATITTTTPPKRCSNGYTFYPGSGRNFCFRFASDCKSFSDAQTACRLENADLLVLDDDSLQPFLELMSRQLPTTCQTSHDVWLNARTDDFLNVVYPDGRSIPLDVDLWGFDEPDNPNDCLVADIFNGRIKLFDSPCDRTEMYICQHF